jgi:PleD family two-component response regulator
MISAFRMGTGTYDSTVPEPDGKARDSSEDAPGKREAVAASHRVPVVLVVDAVPHRAAAIRAWAWQRRGVRPLFAASATIAYETAAREQPEVAIIDLMFRNGRGLAVAIELRRIAPDVEIVFIVEDSAEPEVQAALDLGWERLVSVDHLEQWLDRGLKPLAKLARVERELRVARREAETAAAGNVVPSIPNLPLSVAERRYRETFLRSKMATAGERREAARLAGVPYTTFCVMLRKLGIKH